MYQIVASDLDGTLLTSEHQITTYTKQILTQLHQQGKSFIFATGRHHVDVAAMREQVGIPAFMITSNGARVHDSENTLIFQQNIAAETIQSIMKILAADKTLQANLYRNDDWLVSREDFYDTSNEAHFSYKVFDINNPPVDGVAKIFIKHEQKNHDKLALLETQLNAKFSDKVHITFSSPNCLEIMDKGVSKGHALQAIAKMKGYELKDCIAFGDGMNDFEMLSMAGKGLIMETAHHKVKEALPNLEVIGRCDDEAVANYLAKHLLVQK